MKVTILFIIYFACYRCSAQVSEFTVEGIEKEVVKINDTLYAFRCETSNREYATFLNEIAKKDSSLYLLYCIDSSKWLGKDYNGSMARYYHRHPGFANYPVLCVPYEGAIAYCNWLTNLYNKDKTEKYKRVFVLPSEKEWELAAMGNRKDVTYPWGTNSLRDTRKGSWQGQFLANYRHIGDGSIVSDDNGNPLFVREEQDAQGNSFLNDRVLYTTEVRSFYPNSIGIYNLSGNAAEMTAEKGFTKGGSWNSYGGEITIRYKLYFFEASPEVGFRVFMKIIER